MTAANVRDVTDDDFLPEVIERSHEVPVLVDFWAEWCGPCRMLGPILEDVAAELAGEIELVKVDTETARRVAAEYRISSIPAVKLFRGGRVVGEFVGALPKPRVMEFLREHLPSPAQLELERGRQAMAAGDEAVAKAALEAAIAADGNLGAARVELARLQLGSGDVDAARATLEPVSVADDAADDAQYLRQACDLVAAGQAAGGLEAARAAVAASGDDLDARYALAACLFAAGEVEPALDELLESVGKNRKHADEAARKAMLTIFGVIGVRSEVSDAYRKKLSLLL